MSRVKSPAVVLVALVGLLAVSSVAMAEHEESHPEDTWFSFGYEVDDHFLAINISPNTEECVLENGALTGTYGDETDGIYEVGLPSPYVSCVSLGTVVSGPNGQVNHGQFMKAAKGLLDLKGHGCVVRYLAKSSIGKTDETKVKTSDAAPIDIGEDGEFTFSTFEADCNHGKKDKDGETEGSHKGRPESPGKSGEAPGKNK